MRLVKDKIIWGERTMFPMYYGFCPNAKAWDKSIRNLITPPMSPNYPKAYGMTTHLTDFSERQKQMCIVTVSDTIDTKYLNDVTSVLAHETMHVWQLTCQQVGEPNPGWETEAYCVAAIFDNLFSGYLSTRLCPSKVGPFLPLSHNPLGK